MEPIAKKIQIISEKFPAIVVDIVVIVVAAVVVIEFTNLFETTSYLFGSVNCKLNGVLLGG